MYQRTAQDQRIIVGIDGSASSRAALAWAVGQASRTAGLIEAVTVLDDPDLTDRPRSHVAGGVDPVAHAERRLADLIAETRTQLGGPPLAIITRVLRGDPAKLLTEIAEDAQMLVVGRGSSTDLGHVSARCVQDASGTVAIIAGTLLDKGCVA